MDSLISLKIDPELVAKGVKALESIAETLREYCFPRKPDVLSKPAPPENLTVFDQEAEWEREAREEANERAAEQQP